MIALSCNKLYPKSEYKFEQDHLYSKHQKTRLNYLMGPQLSRFVTKGRIFMWAGIDRRCSVRALMELHSKHSTLSVKKTSQDARGHHGTSSSHRDMCYRQIPRLVNPNKSFN